MFKRYHCSTCGHRLKLPWGRWERGPNWIGTFRAAYCSSCDRKVMIFRDEHKKLVGSYTGFNPPYWEKK